MTEQTPDTETVQETGSMPLAIVGIGCLFPQAGNAAEFWHNIREGVDAIRDVPDSHWRPQDYFDSDPAAPDMTYAHRGGFLDPVEFDPLLYGLSPNNIEATDTTQLLGMVIARQALLDAGYATGRDSGDGRPFDRDRTCVILGVTGALELVIPLGARLGHPVWRKALADAGVDPDTAEDVVRRIADGYVPWQENSFPGLLGNVAAGRIANRFDLGGTNCVVDAACASSLSAVHMAAMELYSGRADMAITGGIDTFNDIFMYMCFSKTPALSPTGNSKPFDSEGDGTILGEGMGVVILKRLDDARRNGDRIYAVLRGMGSSSDGRGNAIYAPSASGQIKALQRAYADAGVSPRSIELVEAHGTGTRVGDAVEVDALSTVYREDRSDGTWCAIGSVKSMIGHTKAAAGMAGMIKVVKALQHRVLPPTIKVQQPLQQLAPGSAPVYVNTLKRPWLGTTGQPRRAALSAFGFGGSNFHCVLEEYSEAQPAIEWDGTTLMLGFCAETPSGLEQQLAEFAVSNDWQQTRTAAAQSLQQFEPGAACRLLLVLERNSNVEKKLQSARQMLSGHADKTEWSTPDGIWYSSREERGGIALLFPGQGSQYVNMLLDLACQFPQVQQALQQANREFSECNQDHYLSELIYPVPVFNEADEKEGEARLRATVHAQPAIGAVSLGALEVARHFALPWEAAAGHSFGELTALCASGRITDRDLHRLANKRGSLMHVEDGDHGAMLAVSASAEVVHEMLENEQLDLVIANHNAPTQVVLSGATEQIEQADGLLSGRGIRSRRLPVAAAFHSSYVAAAEKPLAQYLQTVEFDRGTATVYANTTARPYPADINDAKQLLARQLARPVEFVSQIETMYADGIDTFVELGPGNTLTGLVNAILQDRPHRAMALDASRGKRAGQYDLACMLAQLGVAGYPLALQNWDAGYLDTVVAGTGKPALTVTLSGANYVSERKQDPPRSRPATPVTPQPVQHGKMTTAVGGPVIDSTKLQSGQLDSVLAVTQQSILALQKMQEQTAALHKEYLQGQDTAQQTIRQLIQQQQQLLGGGANLTGTAPVAVTEVTSETRDVPASVTTDVVAEPATGTETAVVPEHGHAFYEKLLLEVVAEKTGYPAEMLSLDMSLDTDLGIDSIKRVEILSALQEKLPAMNRIQPEQLTTFQVLTHIVEYLASDAVSAAAPAPVSAAPAGSAPVTAAMNHDRLQETLLAVVAGKTGYPQDMLDPAMNLDTDLGIDSIKRVEILSAFQEQMPEAPQVNPEDLASLHTLQQIIDFMAVETGTPASQPAVAGNDTMTAVLLAVVAEKTGYPQDMLDPAMNLDTDLGIDSIKRVEILSAFQERMPEAPQVNPEDLASLHSLQQIIDYMQDGEAVTPVIAPVQSGPSPATGPLQQDVLYRCLLHMAPVANSGRGSVSLAADAVVCITDDGTALPRELAAVLQHQDIRTEIIAPGTLPGYNCNGLVILAPVEANGNFVTSAFELMQHCYTADLQLLACITRLGGTFGIDSLSTASPYAAALCGLVKTAAREWDRVTCRVIDTMVETGPGTVDTITSELLRAGPVETGVGNSGVHAPVLNMQRLQNFSVASTPLAPGDVVVISGGARGVTAEVAFALADTFAVNLLLLGRTDIDEPEPGWLLPLQDETAIKQAIIDQQSGAKPDVQQAEQMYRGIVSRREIRANLERIRSTGATVSYMAVDIRDSEAVARCIDSVRGCGPVRGVVHGAGVLADRLIIDKNREQFAQVWSTKVDGIEALLAATREDDLAVLVMFSSSTARFGRKGQSDYAAANEVLNKIARRQKELRPECRVVSVNWGPWDGGMVTGQLKQMFRSEGVDVIPLAAGARYLMQEISIDGPAEIVLLASRPDREYTINDGSAGETDLLEVSFERIVNIIDYPVLRSHVMNGNAVLPAAIIAEWLIHGAVHNHPGLVFTGMDEFVIYKGVILQEGDEPAVQILSGADTYADGVHRIPVELRNGNTRHARAVVLLGSAVQQPLQETITITGDYPYAPGEFYSNGLLFHGQDLHAITRVLACSEKGITAKVQSAPAPARWMKQPIRSSWYADPLVLDAAFQLMILWCFQHTGTGSLPTGLGRYRQYLNRMPEDGVSITVEITGVSEHAASASIIFHDNSGGVIASISDYQCVLDKSLGNAFRQNVLVHDEKLSS